MNNLNDDAFYDINDNDDNDFNIKPEIKTDSIDNLTIFNYQDEIIKAVENNQFIIIKGETGCGKTTQLPQILHKAKLFRTGMIGITQPRRIAVITMAKRVAAEMKECLGILVGYHIRFDAKCGASTKIKFMTDGILVHEITVDPLLKEYGIIIVDEAHERSVTTDIVLGLLKEICKNRKDLKVIIASATLNTSKFTDFLGKDCKLIEIYGRCFNVKTEYMGYYKDYKKGVIETISQICKNYGKGDILVFLAGEEDIITCYDKLSKNSQLFPVCLFGAMDVMDQNKVFCEAPDNKRKVILSTNIAETSITVRGIKFVIDCGYVKQTRYNYERGFELLECVKISKAQAEQRKGRAGRVDDGVCFRLYEESCCESFEEELAPEIYRKHFGEFYLKLAFLQLDPFTFQYIDSPDPKMLEYVEKELRELLLLDKNNKPTAKGKLVVKFPIDPVYGVALMASFNYRCINQVVTIISMLQEKFVFKRPLHKRELADAKKRKLIDNDSDHFTLLNLYNIYHSIASQDRKNWCYDNFVDMELMVKIGKIRNQLLGLLKKNHIAVENNETIISKENVKKCFVTGYFKNICLRTNMGVYKRVYDKEIVYVHPSSSLFQLQPKIILYNDLLRTKRPYVHGVMGLDESFLRKHFVKELESINFPSDVEEWMNTIFH